MKWYGILIGLVVIVGVSLLILQAHVQAEYGNIQHTSPCWITGSTFDTVAQDQACRNYIQSGGVSDTLRTTNQLIDQGLQKHKDKDYDASISLYQKALKISPDSETSADAHFGLALSYDLSGDTLTAIYHMEKAKQYAGISDDWDLILAEWYFYMEQPSKALEILYQYENRDSEFDMDIKKAIQITNDAMN